MSKKNIKKQLKEDIINLWERVKNDNYKHSDDEFLLSELLKKTSIFNKKEIQIIYKPFFEEIKLSSNFNFFIFIVNNSPTALLKIYKKEILELILDKKQDALLRTSCIKNYIYSNREFEKNLRKIINKFEFQKIVTVSAIERLNVNDKTNRSLLQKLFNHENQRIRLAAMKKTEALLNYKEGNIDLLNIYIDSVINHEMSICKTSLKILINTHIKECDVILEEKFKKVSIYHKIAYLNIWEKRGTPNAEFYIEEKLQDKNSKVRELSMRCLNRFRRKGLLSEEKIKILFPKILNIAKNDNDIITRRRAINRISFWNVFDNNNYDISFNFLLKLLNHNDTDVSNNAKRSIIKHPNFLIELEKHKDDNLSKRQLNQLNKVILSFYSFYEKD